MKVASVYIMRNGMVAAFDSKDQQIPELQGCIFEVMSKIGEKADEETRFYVYSPFPSSEINVVWYFVKKKKVVGEEVK